MKLKTNLQTTTHLGIYSAFSGILSLANDVPLHNVWAAVQNATVGDVVTALLPFVVAVWAIFHDETGGSTTNTNV